MAAVDPFPSSIAIGPVESIFAITPHDTNEIAFITRGLYVGVSGNVKVTDCKGNDVTMVGLAAGIWHPVRVKRVFSTGTAATSILGCI